MPRRFNKIYRFTLVITFCLFILILASVDWEFMRTNISKYNLDVLCRVMFIYFLIVFFKGLRSRALTFDSKPSISKVYLVNAELGLYQSLLPSQSADFLYAGLMKIICGTGLRYGNMAILFFRIGDALVLSVLLLGSIMYIDHDVPPYLEGMAIVLLFLSISMLVKIKYLLMFLAWVGDWTSKIFSRSSGKNKLREIVDELVMEMKGKLTSAHATIILLYSLIAWFLMAYNFMLLLNLFRVDVNIYECIFLVSIVNLSALLPLSSIGGIGIREPALILGLVFLGNDLQLSTVSALLVRLPLYLIPMFVGGCFFIYRHRKYFTRIGN